MGSAGSTVQIQPRHQGTDPPTECRHVAFLKRNRKKNSIFCVSKLGLYASFENFLGYILKDKGLYADWQMWRTDNVTIQDLEAGIEFSDFANQKLYLILLVL